ncbi:SAM-dependent methyltransferase [Microvirga guangxiensis]|uniref:Methyltransferase domain-containing protein n=1 Tax=Microvirga guangxiensis TaxID=549386 RepID=A0A1G5EFA6_9HYPH|nr:class I SAM-dependent methyltransferase [Microvirga guangxiensis]SCY25654.1 Methyltransferase domain-containing protein [Microvirga guangxiensis]
MGFRPWRRPSQPILRRGSNEVLDLLERADEALWFAHALTACSEAGVVRHLESPSTLQDISKNLSLDPGLAAALVDVLVGAGLATCEDDSIRAAPALQPFTTEDGAKVLQAALQAPLLQVKDFRERLRDGRMALNGWTHTDEAIIEAQGALTRLWTAKALPKLKFLPGLVTCLERQGASLLDVGAGAAGLSITLCQAFPHLTATALEPAEHPAIIGERHVREAGLDGRIVLRRQRIEHIEDEEAFDLAFLPQMFLSDPAMSEAARRIFRSLRPGGWLLVAVLADEGHGIASSVNRLKNLLWGGHTRSMDSIKPHFVAAGFNPVIRAPGGRMLRMICARRPVSGRSP